MINTVHRRKDCGLSVLIWTNEIFCIRQILGTGWQCSGVVFSYLQTSRQHLSGKEYGKYMSDIFYIQSDQNEGALSQFLHIFALDSASREVKDCDY
jgi:hypothetical protein